MDDGTIGFYPLALGRFTGESADEYLEMDRGSKSWLECDHIAAFCLMRNVVVRVRPPLGPPAWPSEHTCTARRQCGLLFFFR